MTSSRPKLIESEQAPPCPSWTLTGKLPPYPSPTPIPEDLNVKIGKKLNSQARMVAHCF
jgi:hypothetical protein